MKFHEYQVSQSGLKVHTAKEGKLDLKDQGLKKNSGNTAILKARFSDRTLEGSFARVIIFIPHCVNQSLGSRKKLHVILTDSILI